MALYQKKVYLTDTKSIIQIDEKKRMSIRYMSM